MILSDQQRRLFAAALAALAGFVDAVGFIVGHGYFVSFMSGNTTRLGVALGTSVRDALVPALLIAGFVAGVAGGALLVERAGRWRKVAVLALVAALLAIAAAGQVLQWPVVMMAALVLAMGALNNTFQRDGEVAVGLTYMTGALVKLGIGIARLLGGKRDASAALSWALLWGGLLAGAVLGAFVQDRAPLASLGMASAWAAAMVAVALRLPPE
ncbi:MULTISPECIES: YoaK family protein [Novosphingobium]|uniref:YoaK family protein n=1 Tax=Novosphingobium TaxID=165696 RepID=UPI000D6E63D9|nr:MULTISPECIES: YoaK family protein [Novosphingobium]